MTAPRSALMQVARIDRFPPPGAMPRGVDWRRMRRVVVHVLLLALGCGGGAGGAGLLPGKKPGEVPGPPVGLYDGGDIQSVDAGGGAAQADAAPAAPPDAEQFPSCAAIGFMDQVMFDCDEPPPTPTAWARRTPDQHYSCARCAGPAGEATARSCAARPRGPGLPWLCVASCSSCPFFDCRGVTEGSPCKLAGFPDAGMP